MKCLLILAVTIAAVAGSSNLFDPSEDNSYQCCMCGDPLMRTWNGIYTMVQTPWKYLLARFDDGTRNACKFQIRCVIMDTYKNDGDMAPPYIDWCGISVHQHKSQLAEESNTPGTPNSKFFRRYMIGQRLDYFGVSGTGIKPWETRSNDENNPLYFPRENEDRSVKPWADNGTPFVPPPACEKAGDPYTYAMWIDQSADVIKFRSYCCGWAVDFWPRGRDTCVNIYAEKGNPFIENTAKDNMEGLCGGTLDGPTDGDWSTCRKEVAPGVWERLPVTQDESGMAEMAMSCKEGDHDGQKYTGGTRLDNPSG